MFKFISKPKNDAKKIFRTKGACSHTLFYIINREYQNTDSLQEKASDLFAGGIMQQGYQCGMLWGASMAAGKEAYRIYNSKEETIFKTVEATQELMKSFKDHTNCIDCSDFTTTDFNSKMSFIKYMISGKFLGCFNLAEDWSPKAIKTVKGSLNDEKKDIDNICSCASITAERMGANEEEQAIVAGFAGGMGLSGNGCGALATAIWLKAQKVVKDDPEKEIYKIPELKEIMDKFYTVSDYEVLCENICGKKFESIEDHSKYIKEGGCKKIIDYLAEL